MKHYIFILSALTATAAVAQNTSSNTSPPPPQVLLCKLVQDSVLRLNCYDNAVSALTSQPVTVPPASKQRLWDVVEESEGRPRINATLIGANDLAGMVIRCRDNRTSVSINFKAALRSTDNQVRVVYQLEKGKQIEEQWKVASDVKSVSPSRPITFIRSLPDNGAMSIQVFADADLLLSETFSLGDVTSVRTKLGSQCVWPDTANTTTQKRIPLPRSSPIRSNQDDGEKQSAIPSWLSNILK